MMKWGNEKDIWRHKETKGKQTELMWLPAPICKVFNSPENLLATPIFTLSTPEPHLSSDTLIMLHTFTFEVCLACGIFLWALPGVPARQPERGEWDRKAAPGRWGGGGLIYIQDHTDTDAAPPAKLKLKRKPPKNQSRGLGEETTAQPADFGHHGTSVCTCAFVPAYAEM